MTNKELSKLKYLKKEIEVLRFRIKELENVAQSCSSNITGMPPNNKISDKVGKYASEIADLKCLLDLKMKECFFELNRLTRYIEEVDDTFVKLIMNYRYIHGYSWQKTAYAIGGRNNSESLKKRLYRFLNKSKMSLNVPFLYSKMVI